MFNLYLTNTELLAFHQKEGGIATIAAHQRQVHVDLGVVQSNAEHTITGYIEKPTNEYTVSMRIYVFEPRTLLTAIEWVSSALTIMRKPARILS